ncbi:helix-turn-helix transcriptional regulator [Psychromicrobium sp. YIM B11713]|uniref:helix-turn-helix transcriptional regulator n=1 Tax=Psychromicrobium sp. YIM B11713 TaxID=3145233 RepID=UPI00374E7597
MAGTVTPQGSPDNDERTRDRVRGAVLEHGPVSATQLGRMLGLTPAAIRRHLDQLEKSGVIEVKLVRGSGTGAGRPARRYVLSSQGQSGLGNDYLQIARTALKQLIAANGPGAVKAFAEDRFSAMKERYAPLLAEAGDDVVRRAEILSAALSADGYVASAQQLQASGPLQAVQLCQGHCPVLELAAEYPEFCEAETEAFSQLLGLDVRRLSTLASGGHVCTTHIPTGRPSTEGGPEQARLDLLERQL